MVQQIENAFQEIEFINPPHIQFTFMCTSNLLCKVSNKQVLVTLLDLVQTQSIIAQFTDRKAI